MSREFELAREAAKGAIHLFIGKIFSRVIGIVGGLILIRLLKPEGYGLLNVALVAPGIFTLFSDLGVNAAITKNLAEYRSKDEASNLKPFLYSGLAFRIALSLGLTILCYVVVDVFATVVVGKPEAAVLSRVASLLILSWMLYGFSQSVFLGLDSTKSYVAIMILYEILAAFLPIALVIHGMGVWGALFGMAVASLISGLAGVLISVLIVAKIAQGSRATLSLKSALKIMLVYGTPLGAANLITSGRQQYYSFMIATYAAASEIGNYNAAHSIMSGISYLSLPVSTVLFPTFSKINLEKEKAVLGKLYNYSVKYSSFFILPAIASMVILARPAVILLFGMEYENSWIYLTLLAICWLKYGFGRDHLSNLLNAQGETRFMARLSGLTSAIAIFLGLILIPSYGIFGLILTVFVVDWPSYFIALKKAVRKYKVKFPLNDVWRLYITTAITAMAMASIALQPLNGLLKLALGVSTGLVIYIVAVPLIKAMSENDVNNLRKLLKPLPLVNVIADKLFRIMERIARLRIS